MDMRVGNEELEHGSATEPRRGFWTPEKRTPANLAVLLIIGVLVTIGLTTPIIVLNERAIADGTRVYFGNRIILDEDPIIVGRIIHDANRTRFAGERNHYAGHWYGGAVSAMKSHFLECTSTEIVGFDLKKKIPIIM